MDTLSKLKNIHDEIYDAVIPGSKSFTNRALLIAAHRVGKTIISDALICDDTCYLAKAIDAFGGISVTQEGTTFTVIRDNKEIFAPSVPIFLGGAGTPVRLMLTFASTANGETLVTGNARLTERPMKDILNAFDTAGIEYQCKGVQGFLPVLVTGAPAKTDSWQVNGDISSQFLTSLLLHASQQSQFDSVTVSVPGHLVSRPYINMTLEMMRSCGLQISEPSENTFTVMPCSPTAEEIRVEVDASGMSYLLTAAAITNSSVRIPGITLNSAQGDAGLAKVYEQMGCKLTQEEDAIVLTGDKLSGLDVDMEDMPDVVLSLAIAATQASTPTTITNIANLRVKECDRIAACCNELARLGIQVEEGSDWLRVYPAQEITPAQVHTYDDHRVAMAFSLLGLLNEGVSVEDPNCVSKSFPKFWEEMSRFINFHSTPLTAEA